MITANMKDINNSNHISHARVYHQLFAWQSLETWVAILQSLTCRSYLSTRKRPWECISPQSKFLQKPPFRKILGGHVRTVLVTCTPNLKSVALTVLNWIDWPVRCERAHTHENRSSAIHSVHLAEVIKKLLCVFFTFCDCFQKAFT